MRDDVSLLEGFAEGVKREFPEYASYLTPVPATLPPVRCHEVIAIPWPPNPSRCRLSAYYRGDCFEMSFFVAGTHGPAESQIVGHSDDDPGTMVEDAISFLADFLSERLVIVVERYRWLWFPPYYLPFFRLLSQRSRGNKVCEVLSWRGTYNEGHAAVE